MIYLWYIVVKLDIMPILCIEYEYTIQMLYAKFEFFKMLFND